jgi:rubrerythrin
MEALTVLAQALKLEADGRAAYLQAAGRSQDAETAGMFRSLAEDEQHHQDYIQRQVDALQAGRPWVAVPELPEVEPVDAADPVFPSGKKALDVLPADATDEDALLFGLNAEVKSYELYTRSASQVDDPAARKMFLGLASAERGHFDLLMMRYESRFGYPR